MTKPGKFITFDGIDGAGKTTQIEALSQRLQLMGKSVYVTREPGGTKLSEAIRTLLLSTEQGMAPITELLLMFAARAEHVETVIRPKILAGQWVICSRFTDATMAYQGYARGQNLSDIQMLGELVHGDCHPDLTLFLDLSAELAAKRRYQRGEASDRFESEDLAFMQAVRKGYLAIARADTKRCKVVDAGQSVASIATAVNNWVDEL